MFSSLLLEFFQEALPLWGGDQLFKGWEVESVQKLLPQGDDPRKRWVSQPLFKDQSGRSVMDVDVMELMKVSCCCDMNEDMSLEPRRLVRATLGHLTGRP